MYQPEILNSDRMSINLKLSIVVILCFNPLTFIAHMGKSQETKKGKQSLITAFFAAIINNL